MVWVVVISEYLVQVTEFAFFCLGCATVCLYAGKECFKAADFVLCGVIAIVAQYLIGVGILSVDLCGPAKH